MLGLAAGATSPPPPTTVASVELHLPPGADPSGFASLIAIQTGDSFSLRAVRRTVERLFATGRLADVVVVQIPVPGGVNLRFELSPKRRIASIRVKDNRVLSKREILKASKLAEGTEYYPERIDEGIQAIERAYRRRGYEHARILAQVTDGPQGVELLLAVSEGEPTRISGIAFAGTPGLPLVRLLEVVGLDVGSVLNLDRLDAGLERLRAIYRQERFYRAKVGEPVAHPGPDGTAIAVPTDAGPRYVIHFDGNRSFRDQVMLAVLHYDGTEVLDRDLVDRFAHRLENFYRYRGFNDVRVEPKETFSGDHLRAVLAFEIEEGLPLVLSEARFEGNSALAAEELRKVLVETVRFRAPELVGDVHPTDDPLELEGRTSTSQTAAEPDPEAGSLFVEEAYREAADNMTQVYRDRGFLEARVSLSRLDRAAAGTGSAQFKVVEGVQTLVEDLSYRGVPPGFDPQSAPGIQVGEPLSASALERKRSALLRGLGRKGYLFGRVETSTQLSADRTRARVFFQLDGGPQVRVGQVILQGLNRTHPEVVRANLAVRPGAVLDPEGLFESQRNLVVLGIFRQVTVRLIDPETPESVKDVVVELREAPRLDGNVFGGYSLVEGPVIGGDALYPNLTGRAINVSARAKVNYAGFSALAIQQNQNDLQGFNGLGGRANITIQQPRIYALLPQKLGVRLDLVGERVFRPSYRFTRFAAIPGLDWIVYQWLTVSLQYSIEHDRVRAPPDVEELLPTLPLADQERLRFPVGNFTLHSLRPAVALDFRDDVANPHRGLLITGSSEFTHDLGATITNSGGVPISSFPIFTAKLSGNITGYIPIARRVTLAISARGGEIFHLDPHSQTIPPQRFFLGGTSSMRGFREDGLIPEDRRQELHQELADCRALITPAGCTASANVLQSGNEVPSEGGELFTLGKTELRFPAFGAFDFGVFFEAGNLWLSLANYKPLSLRYTAGAGVRYGTPIGPLALDLGFNLSPDSDLNESAFQVHFSIGLF